MVIKGSAKVSTTSPAGGTDFVLSMSKAIAFIIKFSYYVTERSSSAGEPWGRSWWFVF